MSSLVAPFRQQINSDEITIDVTHAEKLGRPKRDQNIEIDGSFFVGQLSKAAAK